MNITNKIVFNKLINLKSSKSAGPDGIHPRVLKETAVQLCAPLTTLFNRLLNDYGIVA